MVVEHIGHGRIEKRFLTVEVVVKRTHSDVCRLRDFQHRHVELALGDQGLRSLDQRCAGALFSPFQAVGRLVLRCAHQ
ncbi:Uncharacterised protein [Mycobacteroides abscessus subsp. abscessus]|nr:Uncharacterised protein [Mycobacteroides abscessus subsp. abscessus]